MGEVYLAVDPDLGRPVAIKVLQKGLVEDDTMRRRFLTEARTIAALSHPNVVVVHEAGVTGEDEGGVPAGLPYLVMEFIEGRSLAEILEEKRLSLAEATSIARQVLEGLKAAHDRRLIHRG